MAISNRTAPVTVEYAAAGERCTKTFIDAHAGRRFYVAKDKAGMSPRVVPTAEVPPSKPPAGKHIAVYMRVSGKGQNTKCQEPDLERWAAAQGQPVKWYTDKATGKTMDRPGWAKLDAAVRQGRVSAVVVWRIDRLGRTANSPI